MNSYIVFFSNNNGHLISLNKVPEHVWTFAYNKAMNKLDYATDNTNLGYRYIILRHGLNDRWTYILPDMTITLDYIHLDKFDSIRMNYL